MNGIPRLHGNTHLKHYLCYHVFHGGSSYGNSVFNTTYNFNGGNMCGGGFWGGFLGGIGMGLGGMLGNLFGFGGGGCFGGGLFGGGFPSFNMFGGGFANGFPALNFWGGNRSTTTNGGNTTTTGASTTTSTKDKDNKDYEPIRKLRSEYTDLLDNISKKGKDDKSVLTAAKTLYNKVIGYGTPNDGVADAEDLKNLTDLQTKLEEKFENIKDNQPTEPIANNPDNPNDDTTETPDGEIPAAQGDGTPSAQGDGTPAAQVSVTPSAQGDRTPAAPGNGTTEAPGNGTPAARGNETPAAQNDDGHGAGSPKQEDYNKALKDLKFNKKGDKLDNTEDTDFDTLLVKDNKISIIDTSDRIGDFIERKIIDYDKTSKIVTVQVTNGSKIKYKFKEKNANGEMIFVSNKDQQEYVLQKDSKGNIYFMQYSWHKGHNIGDLRAKTKNNNYFDI